MLPMLGSDARTCTTWPLTARSCARAKPSRVIVPIEEISSNRFACAFSERTTARDLGSWENCRCSAISFSPARCQGRYCGGHHKFRGFASGPGVNGRFSFSDNDLVSNAKGEVGVGMPFLATGGTFIVGARWEGWFEQTQFQSHQVKLFDDCACNEGSFTGSGTLDRNNWGPFVRLKIPLGPAPPP
jgi:hypothetical protein